MVAEAGEAAPARVRERLERPGERAFVAVRFDREEVAGEEDEIRLPRHGALADAAETRLGHEGAEVRVGDLHDPERARDARLARGAVTLGSGRGRRAVEDHVHDLFFSDQRVGEPDSGDHEGQPGERQRVPDCDRNGPRQAEQGPRHPPGAR